MRYPLFSDSVGAAKTEGFFYGGRKMKAEYHRNRECSPVRQGEILNLAEVQEHETSQIPEYWYRLEGEKEWRGTNLSPVLREEI